MQKPVLFLIDATAYLYRAHYATPAMFDRNLRPTNALYGWLRSLLRLEREREPKHLAIILDGPKNKKSRHRIDANYKSHRPETPMELITQMKEIPHLCELLGWPFLSLPEVEADDVIGSIAKWAEKEGHTVWICSSDKDFCQLISPQIGLLSPQQEGYVERKEEYVRKKYGIEPRQMVDYLSLVGDASDGIAGVPGIGPKSAATLLQKWDNLERLFSHLDLLSGKRQKALLSEHCKEAFLSQKLARIDCSLSTPQDLAFFEKGEQKEEELHSWYRDHSFLSLLPQKKELSSIESAASLHFVREEESLLQLCQRIRESREIHLHIWGSLASPVKGSLQAIALSMASNEIWILSSSPSLSLKRAWKECHESFCTEERKILFLYDGKRACHLLDCIEGSFPSCTLFDLMIAHYLLQSEQKNRQLHALLLSVTDRYTFSEAELMTEMPGESIALHTLFTALVSLGKELSAQLQARKMESLFYEVEIPLLFLLARMEEHGIHFDTEALKSPSERVHTELTQLQEEIFSLAGRTINLNSPKQLGELLFNQLQLPYPKKKSSSSLSTRAAILQQLAPHYPIAAKILSCRSLEKLRSTYLEALPHWLCSRTKCIHCRWNQCVTATGRLSSESPNLQNIPKQNSTGMAIRSAFLPRHKGMLFLSADYSQIELRLLAHLSGDPLLLDAFRREEDVHCHIAAQIFHCSTSEVSREQRERAKMIQFSLLYGKRAFTLARDLSISLKQAEKWMESYFLRYEGVARYLHDCKERAKREGKVATLLGRERKLPEIQSSKATERAFGERLALNTPIQGSSADLIKMAMLTVDRQLRQEGMRAEILLQIHDELLLEVPQEELDQVAALVHRAMEGVWILSLPLRIRLYIGANWGEMQPM